MAFNITLSYKYMYNNIQISHFQIQSLMYHLNTVSGREFLSLLFRASLSFKSLFLCMDNLHYYKNFKLLKPLIQIG